MFQTKGEGMNQPTSPTGGRQSLSTQAADFSAWYTGVVLGARLADYGPVRGTMVIRPYGYALWELMQARLDARLKATGIENAYFPLFVPESLLQKEADHVEGFTPEVAWVTHGGDQKLEERLAVRPTSEAVIMSMYAKWVQSYRDLPILINQWGNAVRWELRTRLFLRTSEFLWQEGHTLHATANEATERAFQMLEVYRRFLIEDLAIPVIAGRKTPAERFPGAAETYTVEALMRDGRALQSGTSHDFHDHFSRAFAITFQDRDGVQQHGFTTSWGLSTRTIGALVMVHGDDQGLKLPPLVAPVQVVVIPIWPRGDDRSPLNEYLDRIMEAAGPGTRIKLDADDEKSPGWKFNEWELRGAPLRIEAGSRDLAAGTVVVVRRDTGAKEPVQLEHLADRVRALLEEMQRMLYADALDFQTSHTVSAASVEALTEILDRERGFVRAGWCSDPVCEARVNQEARATARCIPFDQPESLGKCLVCGEPASAIVLYARAY